MQTLRGQFKQIYGLPLTRVLALRRAEVAITATFIILWPNADALPFGEPLAGAFHRWAASSGPWVFPGRHGHQPLSEAAVAYHLADDDKHRSRRC